MDEICDKLNDQTSDIEELEEDLISCVKDLIKQLTKIKKSANILHHDYLVKNLIIGRLKLKIQ